MGSMNIKMKLMPASVEADLEGIKTKVKEILENKNEVKTVNFEEEPLAFGLKSLIISFIWPEDKEFEPVENELGKIENVNSAETIDLRRTL